MAKNSQIANRIKLHTYSNQSEQQTKISAKLQHQPTLNVEKMSKMAL